MSKWEQHDNRVKFVYSVGKRKYVFITLDGMFHSWAVPYEHNEDIWEIRTVVEPNFSFTYIDIFNWMDEIS